MMRKIYLCISLLIFFISCTISHAEEISVNDPLYISIRDNTCIPLFTALKEGDVETIKDIYSNKNKSKKKHKDLLDRNTEYSNFLKDYYRDVTFLMNSVVREEEQTFVNIIVYFPDGNQMTRRWFLKKEKRKKGDDIWKVEDEIVFPR